MRAATGHRRQRKRLLREESLKGFFVNNFLSTNVSHAVIQYKVKLTKLVSSEVIEEDVPVFVVRHHEIVFHEDSFSLVVQLQAIQFKKVLVPVHSSQWPGTTVEDAPS